MSEDVMCSQLVFLMVLAAFTPISDARQKKAAGNS
jgi:hypothetical protein